MRALVKPRLLAKTKRSYYDFHMAIGPGHYIYDVDGVEWRRFNGVPRPVAVIENTTVQDARVPPSYFERIAARYRTGGQGYHACFIAERLGVFAYIVAYTTDLACFWRYNLTLGGRWDRLTSAEYTAWLRSLGLQERELAAAPPTQAAMPAGFCAGYPA